MTLSPRRDGVADSLWRRALQHDKMDTWNHQLRSQSMAMPGASMCARRGSAGMSWRGHGEFFSATHLS